MENESNLTIAELLRQAQKVQQYAQCGVRFWKDFIEMSRTDAVRQQAVAADLMRQAKKLERQHPRRNSFHGDESAHILAGHDAVVTLFRLREQLDDMWKSNLRLVGRPDLPTIEWARGLIQATNEIDLVPLPVED